LDNNDKCLETPIADKVDIDGHSSSVGSAEYNQFFSQKRADSVKKMFIITYGIDASRLTVVGYGEMQLKDSANNA
jgi:OOP family OmpA-OmpF porin